MRKSSGKCKFTNQAEERGVSRTIPGSWGSSRRSQSPVIIARWSHELLGAANTRNITIIGVFIYIFCVSLFLYRGNFVSTGRTQVRKPKNLCTLRRKQYLSNQAEEHASLRNNFGHSCEPRSPTTLLKTA